MTTHQLTVPQRGVLSFPAIGSRVRALLEQDVFSVLVIAIWVAILAASLPLLVVQDSFLAFVDGRLIARGGLPHVDTVTYWTLGQRWIDQQWGAHLVLYELARHGVRVAAVAGVACVGAALTAAAVASRKLGASPRSTAIGSLLPLVCSSWLAQVRTQSLALLPFVVVYALLASDARRPGRRVLLVLPLLVLWANLHGSVALGAGLAALYGLTMLCRPVARGRGLVLVVGAPLCMLASPYGVDLVGYYRTMLVSPPLAAFVQEWKPPVIGIPTLPFFASAFLLTALWARHQRVLTSFERWAIPVLLVGAMAAVRNAVWFELAAVVSLPRLLDALWPSRIVLTPQIRRLNLLLGSAATLLSVSVLGSQLAHPSAPLRDGRSPAAAAAVAAAAGPHGIVLADDLHADWLLWEQPSLVGRVAFDVRFEFFDRRQLQEIVAVQKGLDPVWTRCGVRASVVTLPGATPARSARFQGSFAQGARRVVSTPGFSAVAQTPAGRSCRRL